MHRSVRFAAAALALTAVLLAPQHAYAADDPLSPCVPTDEQVAAYSEDGTLQERIAFQESLGNDEPSPDLIQQAIAREQERDGIATNAVPGEDSGMATTGEARVVALRVSFPDHEFEAGDTLEALQALIGPRYEGEEALSSAGPFPYDSLHAYYQRSSYGTLSVTGEAFDYEAKYERDYYTANIGELFTEALSYLDEEGVDLSQFDANGDKRIDAVYLHFAGGDTGWGTTWWSNEQVFYGQTTEYTGGVRLWNGVALANPSNESWGAQTIIHETGHVLGLPDFYSYASQTGGQTGRTGILTFDMMMQNQGDHNGLSKWLLDWLPDEKVTRVRANENGIDVTRGGRLVEHVDAADDGTSSIEQALDSFTSDELKETGGVIVASNKDAGMLSSYYLLQYDRFAGNQSVFFSSADGLTRLPSGFRLFRVQADVGEYGGLLHSNTSGTVHNQLIELVDPDMSAVHVDDSATVPSAIGADAYGCMLYAGDAVTPRGYPSTNFYENSNIGFTGLTFAVTSSDGESGRVSISYSGADKPADPADFALTPTFDAVSNVGTLTFEASSQPLLATPLPSAVQLIVDGEAHALLDIAVDGTTVSLPCLLDAGDISPTSVCEIVFPAGLFVLSQSDGQPAYSPEIRIVLKPDLSMTPVSRSGTYTGTEYEEDSTALSDVFASPEGTRRFFQLADGVLKLHTIDANDATRVSSLSIEDVHVLASDGEQRISAVPLSNTMALALLVRADGMSVGKGYWIDLEHGDVQATHEFDQPHAMALAGSGSTVLAATYYQGIAEGKRGGMLLTSLTPRADGTVESRYGWTAAETAAPVSRDAFAFGFMSDDGLTVQEARILEVSALAEALATSTSTADNAALAGERCDPERTTAVLPLKTTRMMLDAERTDESFYVLLSSDFSLTEPEAAGSNMIVRFDASGTETVRFSVPIDRTDPYTQLRIARYGTVALLKSSTSLKHAIPLRNALFCADDGQVLSSMTTASSGIGSWLDDGTWLDVGATLAGSFGPKGSPVKPGSADAGEAETFQGSRARYTVTTQLDKVPDEPERPQPLPSPGDGNPAAAARSLAPTGDPTGGIAAMAALVALLAGGLAVRGRRTR